MNPSLIQRTQRERLACVYVRQSTQLQVRHHQESTERQYRLRQRALALGWPPTAVEVIDEDQGRSGGAAAHRPGFQRLVSQVGLVLMLEASRLAGNNGDWHRLIELCGLSGALIANETAVYDPRDPNDRLLLGVKDTLSEAVLFTRRLRLHERRWNKAPKGQLRFPVPVGYVPGADGVWELDPDAQVRERLAYIFAAFRRHGVARAVAREGSALLQGIAWCGLCGRKLSVQHHAARERRSASYLCDRGYQDGDRHLCQSMTARTVDAGVTQAFLAAVAPLQVGVALQVLDQVEQERAAERRQHELQQERACYEARLAQRQ
jgi:DNA invertase Pin-like site-specific DNA recombinase